jgi:hypothetical protein
VVFRQPFKLSGLSDRVNRANPEKHEGPSIARPLENPLEIDVYDQLATPPWRLQAPRRFFACE